MMRWGFKLPDRLVFNERAEGIEAAKFGHDAFLIGRGIAPGDTIYERQKRPAGQKKPKYEFTIPRREPFGMAAVWKNLKTGLWERTFAILTGEPNELTLPIHDRLTTILEPRDYSKYVVVSERPPVHLLRVLPPEQIQARLIEESPITNAQVNLFDSQ